MRFLFSILFIMAFTVTDCYAYTRNTTYNRNRSNAHSVNQNLRTHALNYSNIYGVDHAFVSKYNEEDCVSVLVQALDRACFDDSDVKNGVYKQCADSSISDLSGYMDSNLFYVVPVEEQEQYKSKCGAFKSKAIERFLKQKELIEQGAKESSYECVRAKDLLTKAKNCHAQIIASSGGYFDNKNTCDSEVRREFDKAGDMGSSNIFGSTEKFMSGQFTNKNPNWRQAVDAVLASYMMKAKDSCGQDDFEITDVNLYSADNQSNSITVRREAYAEQQGKNRADYHAVPNKQYGNVGIIKGGRYINTDNIRQIKPDGTRRSSHPVMQEDNTLGEQLDRQIKGYVYSIMVPNIGVAKSRLDYLIENPAGIDLTNPTDIEIAKDIFGAIIDNDNLPQFVSHVNKINSNGTHIFILRSSTTGVNVCSVQKYKNKKMKAVNAAAAIQSKKLKIYTSLCQEITGF